MSYENLTYEQRGQVALVTLSRPEKLNALNHDLQEETRAVCAAVEADDDIRVMIVTGEGRGFCAGADLTSGRSANGAAELPPQPQRLDEMGWVGKQAKAFYQMTKPTIAAVNGIAVGAGMSMALACDMRVGGASARFKTVFIERSLSPDSGMSFFLPRIIGYSRAMDLIMTSRNVDAEEAYRLGLLDRLVGDDELIEASLELANQIAGWPPMAMRSAKRVVQHNLGVDLDEALRYETMGLNFAGRAPHDVAESRASFMEKRAPKFTGT